MFAGEAIDITLYDNAGEPVTYSVEDNFPLGEDGDLLCAKPLGRLTQPL
jgi:hypothetical protein